MYEEDRCCLIFWSIFCSPVAVSMMCGCGGQFWLNVCLYCMGWIPGTIHALYLLNVMDRTRIITPVVAAPVVARPVVATPVVRGYY
uniref:Protein SNA3 n=1 Tax=Strongyloides papillosus TaxID=174720 RepID=A0A0N5BXP5_STREA